MTRYGLVIDANRCMGCWVCTTSCKDEFVGNDILPYSKAQPDTNYGFFPGPVRESGDTASGHLWVAHGQKWISDGETVVGRFPHVKASFVPMPCNHCADAPCIKASKNGAAYRRSDGIVILDPVSGVGQNLTAACPYGRIYWNESLGISQKCTLCAHRVDAGRNPKCVDSCPISALHFGDLDDPTSQVSKMVSSGSAEVLHPEYGTKPNVYFVGLPKPFLSGKIVDGKTGSYLKNATAVLRGMDGTSWTTATDAFGDFEFKNLKIGAVYELEASTTGMMSKKVLVFLDQAKDTGKIQLF